LSTVNGTWTQILVVVGFIAAWILLQAVILPKFGVPT